MTRSTTLQLDPEVLDRAREVATARGITLSALVEQAVREALAGPRAAARGAFKLVTFGGDGPANVPVENPHDSSALLEWAESE